ncbi:hypothetical protein ShirakiTB12_54260 [Priestia megaterium]|uniref:Uncharacterized protein n=1 Tax=Priestia megaterium TaxID=1404 RepID=A0AAX6BTA4_PRIMG|nr:hypothetical protein [Priestia megaterium]GMG76957.1 hypothetical protein ShirakiTB12_54260 [Priestia megaterium]
MLLLNAVQSNDVLIKDMQDKVISMQDSQISFLNNILSNIGWQLGIVLTLFTLIFAGVGWMINRSNQNAQKKMENAERIINEAKNAMTDFAKYKEELEEYRRETKKEFMELIELVNSKEIARLKEDVKVLSLVNRVNSYLVEAERELTMFQLEWEGLKGGVQQEFYHVFQLCQDCISEVNKISKEVEGLTNYEQGVLLLTRCEMNKASYERVFDELKKLKKDVRNTKIHA